MTQDLVNLCLRAQCAADRVERGLAGSRPRDLRKRFRRLLRPAAVVQERVDHPDGTITHVPVTLSHLGLAGHLRMARDRALEEAARDFVLGTVTGRQRMVAP